MARETLNEQNAPPAQGAAPASEKPSQPVHDPLKSTQTDRDSLALRKAQAGASDERPETPKPTTATEPLAARAKEHPLGAAVAASEARVPVEATGALKEQPKTKTEAQTGDKRDHDSTAGPTPGATTEAKAKDNAVPEKLDEPGTKKQKMASESTKQSAQEPVDPTPPASAKGAAGKGPKKTARSKKEKEKDAVKAIPTEGVSSRTRSRTKPT